MNAQQKDNNKLRICILTQPLPKLPGSHVLVHDLIRVLEPISKELFVITDNFPDDKAISQKTKIINIEYKSEDLFPLKVLKFIILQLQICANLARISKDIDIVIFYMGVKQYILPTLFTKLLRKSMVSIVTGAFSFPKEKVYHGLGFYISHIQELFYNTNYKLSNLIIAESPTIIEFAKIKRYENKIAIGGIFFNSELFKVCKDFNKRANIVGYIGRLGMVKGVMNFVKAIPMIADARSEVRFLIGGDGALRQDICDELKKAGLSDKATLTGWIVHEDLPSYLNELRLLVVPSYSESIPIIAIEAMACGTSVLATPVGGIPDVIIDKETGFILENNSPEDIAKRVIRILDNGSLGDVAERGRMSIEDKCTYEAAANRYRNILSSRL